MNWLSWLLMSAVVEPYTICERPKNETYALLECAGKSGLWSASWVDDEDGEPQEDLLRITPTKKGCAVIQRRSDPDWPRRSERVCNPVSPALRCVFAKTRTTCRFK